MRFLRSHLLNFVIILFVSVLLTRHLWSTSAWLETHDGLFHVIRLEEMTKMVKLGQFPVRWAGNLDNGFGLPLFNYVYPGIYYLGLPLTLLGLPAIWVIKLLFCAFYFFGALGIYTALSRSRLAVLAAILFLLTPYVLLNIYVRGALGELAAIALMPWVVWSLADLKHKGLRWYQPLPYFFLFISHNFISFLFLPLYLGLTFLTRIPIKKSLLNLLLSLGLAAFFVFPMILERGYLSSVAANNYTYPYDSHFVYPLQLISSPWGYGASISGLDDGMSFQLGLPHLAVLILALIAFRSRRNPDFTLWLIVTITALFFTLPASTFLWQLVPPLRIMQFPWRMLAFTSLALPFLLIHSLSGFGKKIRLLVMFFLFAGFYFAYRYSTPPYTMNQEQFATQMFIHREKTTTASRLELAPRWAPVEERWKGEDLRLYSGNAEYSVESGTPISLIFNTQSEDGAVFQFRRNYFPTWYAQDENNQSVKLTNSSEGEVLINVAPGTHTYELKLRQTPVELLGNTVTILSLFAILALMFKTKLKKLIDDKYPDWDISIALRYLPIADDLRIRLKDSDRVLEVGSEITGITPYLPRPVTGLDRGFDYSRQNQFLQPVVGSATAIPFADRSYDYVLSVDVLEHIPPRLRAKAVREMLRVTKKKLYLTFPVGKQSMQADHLLDQYFYRQNGRHFTYLTEHVKNGLPDENFIPDLVAKAPGVWELTSRPNTSLFLWIMLLKLGLSNIPWKTSLYRRLLLLIPLLKHLNFPPAYRRLYILTRKT